MVDRVVILSDLEGVAGVVLFVEQSFPGGRYYDSAKRLLTAEVNATVEGLLSMDVSDVLVMDGHGPGGLWFEDLHPRARLLHGRPMAPWGRLAPVIAEHDVVVIVGQRAMAGTLAANLSNTRGFVLLPRRWVVERSSAWMARFRRLTRDYERLSETLVELHFVAFAILMAHRFVTAMFGLHNALYEETGGTHVYEKHEHLGRESVGG